MIANRKLRFILEIDTRCDTFMKKILFILFVTIGVIIGIIYYIGTKDRILDKPLIPEEEEKIVIDDELVEEEETEIEEMEETRLTDRLSLAIQDALDRLFQRELKIVAIGDSLTYGIGDGTNSGGYVGILDRTFNQEKEIVTFANLGMPGSQSTQLLRRIRDPEIQYVLKDADMILITIGANDIMQVARENITNLVIDDFMEERRHYEVRLEGILDTMREINSKAKIFLLGIYNPFEKYFQEIEELNEIVDAWNNTGMILAEEKENITFIPIMDLFSGNDEPIFADDHFHPNYTGYYLIAERVLDYISKDEEG